LLQNDILMKQPFWITPMGELPGKADLNINGNSLSGMLSLLNHDNSFFGEQIDDIHNDEKRTLRP